MVVSGGSAQNRGIHVGSEPNECIASDGGVGIVAAGPASRSKTAIRERERERGGGEAEA